MTVHCSPSSRTRICPPYTSLHSHGPHLGSSTPRQLASSSLYICSGHLLTPAPVLHAPVRGIFSKAFLPAYNLPFLSGESPPLSPQGLRLPTLVPLPDTASCLSALWPHWLPLWASSPTAPQPPPHNSRSQVLLNLQNSAQVSLPHP